MSDRTERILRPGWSAAQPVAVGGGAWHEQRVAGEQVGAQALDEAGREAALDLGPVGLVVDARRLAAAVEEVDQIRAAVGDQRRDPGCALVDLGLDAGAEGVEPPAGSSGDDDRV